jgi:hypothetical protein
MFTCGWCGVHYPKWQAHCSHCGGQMPPEAKGLGPPPKPAPRELPKGFRTRQWFTANFTLVFGLVFFIVGAAITAMFVLVKTWFALAPGLFAFAGFMALLRGIAQARRTLRAFREGEATEGVYCSVAKDPLYARQPGSAPWIIKYAFYADGKYTQGGFSTSDNDIRSRIAVNDPVWVLYVKDDPTQSTVYPPLK